MNTRSLDRSSALESNKGQRSHGRLQLMERDLFMERD